MKIKLVILTFALLLQSCKTIPDSIEPTGFHKKFSVKYRCKQDQKYHLLFTRSLHQLSKPAVCQAIKYGAIEYGFAPNSCQILRIEELSNQGNHIRVFTKLSQLNQH